MIAPKVLATGLCLFCVAALSAQQGVQDGINEDAEAIYDAAARLERGATTLPNRDLAEQLYLQAYTLGHVDAAYRLGVLYQERGTNADSPPNDTQSAIEFYTFAAARGNVNAEVALANIYFVGPLQSQNVYLAYYWYRRAAYNNDPLAQARVAIMHLTGLGAPQSPFEATVWYQIFLTNERSTIVQLLFNSQMQNRFSQTLQALPLEANERATSEAQRRREEIAQQVEAGAL